LAKNPTAFERESQPVPDSRYESKIKTLPPEGSRPPSAPTLPPASSELSATELESIPPHDDSHEETKPLWVGIAPPPESAAGTWTASYPAPESITATHDATFTSGSQVHAPTDARDESAPVHSMDAPGSIDELTSTHDLDAPEALESSPPPSGERASTRSPSEPAPEGPMSLEEPLKSMPAAAPSSPGSDSEPLALSTAELAESSFDEDRESRISDAPASTLGATITLPDEGAEAVELELAEPPPSSMRLLSPSSEQPPAPDSELEVDLPRTSYRAAYDDTLSVPPGARGELAAHDESARQRTPSKPAAEPASPQPSVSYSTPSSARSLPEDDLPAVLSSRPQPSVSAAAQGDGTSPLATPSGVLGTAQMNTGVSMSVQFVPPLGAQPPEFVGERTKPQDSSFLGLLDASLSLDVSP
jgi:hypothetical protein